MRNSKSWMLGLVAASALAVVGCKKKDAEIEKAPAPIGTQSKGVEVEHVKLGNALGSDKTIVEEKEEFRPNDTIYVSVETEGTAQNATMTARWLYGDNQVIEETSQQIVPKDAVATEFHVQKPDGWPAGEYKVEILLNGEKVATEDFEVKAGG
jgi:hypothetical protein